MRDEATQRQVDAATPERSTWLSANAGSGKTKVLTDRVARLLLDGVDPQNILCLTFTKAAATEMQNRLFERLGKWAMLPDDELCNQLDALGIDNKITSQSLSTARRLFAVSIETPGGLKIQTIHSFCASLLRRFPLEAGVSPHFVEMEERSIEQLCADVIEDMATGPDADTLYALARQFNGETLSSLAHNFVRKKDGFEATSDEQIVSALGLSHSANAQTVLTTVFDGTEPDFWPDLIRILREIGGPLYPALADRLSKVDISQPTQTDLALLCDEFLYKSKGNSNNIWDSKSVNFPQKSHKNAIGRLQPVIVRLHALMDRVAAAKMMQLALDAAAASFVFRDFVEAFLPKYETAKQKRGFLDFDDLIFKARNLLTDQTVADWVLFKLDGGIDHILVDEAQDTSPAQWQLIERLCHEFTSGDGARADAMRTVFVVGDKKQSIYSFQGADTDGFDRMKNLFAERLSTTDIPLKDIEMEYSFRSAQTILSLVDQTFDGDEASGFTQREAHKAFKSAMPGRVDLWPVVEKPDAPQEPDWFLPVDIKTPDDPATVLARNVAQSIKDMIGTPLPSEDGNTARAITAGDILILVQRRHTIFREIIRECKKLNLPIAGADRLRIGAELAVKDLCALLSFLTTPEDDLSLANALRSPLFGWSEADLFDLAQGRKQKYLWAELRDKSGYYSETVSVLNDLRDQADYLRPYDMLERILTRHNGRYRLLSRLGSEAEDGIDALLNQAMAYERQAVDSLTGFLVWMQTDDLEIKRQVDNAGDQIRVMTTHGAKGLESPIVILPDCAKRDVKQDALIVQSEDAMLWRPSEGRVPAKMRTIRDQEKESLLAERDRLLYVAMTRAEQWLIVAAAGDLEKTGRDWYSKVKSGLVASDAQNHMFDRGEGLRLEHGNWDLAVSGDHRTPNESLPTLPDVFHTRVASKPVQDKAIAPSDLGGAKALAGKQGQDEEVAKRIGRQVHLLLEHLPNSPEAEWKQVASRLLSYGPETASSAEIDSILHEAAGVLNSHSLAFLFSSTALTEVELTADLATLQGRRIHGIVDRLIVTSDTVLAIDFKTNAIVPDSPKTCPEGLLRQMGAYAHALQGIYPDHKIETALLWTKTAVFMRLPHDLVTDALTNTQIS